MNATELRALAGDVHYIACDGYEINQKLIVAAEVLELLAWAEEREVNVERYGSMWFIRVGRNGVIYGDHSFISTLRRAREAK